MSLDLFLKAFIVVCCSDKRTGTKLKGRTFCRSAVKRLSVHIPCIVNIYPVAGLCSTVCDRSLDHVGAQSVLDRLLHLIVRYLFCSYLGNFQSFILLHSDIFI